MDFTIRILRQGWLGDDTRHDLCSHGEIDLKIGGRQISSDAQLDETWSYGISETALGLLRTLKYRHTDRHRVAERLIPHGCGTILMMGCDIGIDWTVRHQEGVVCISDVVRYDSNSFSEAIEFPDIKIQIPWNVYAEQIVGFAMEARDFFQGIEKDKSSETIEGEYDAFWSEFDHLMASCEAPSERDLFRPGRDFDYLP